MQQPFMAQIIGEYSVDLKIFSQDIFVLINPSFLLTHSN